MPTAKRLPSGSYRVRVYDYTDSHGNQHYKSFTAPTKKEAERAAANYAPEDRTVRTALTFGQCADDYIVKRTPVSSVSTIREYTGYRRRYMEKLSVIPIYRITQDDIQQEINTLSVDGLSPKTVRNVHGFISAVMGAYRPDFALHTVLPKNVPPKLYVPTEAEVKRLMASVSGTVMELPVLLAAFGPMRRGEICALRTDNISGNVVHVCENMVLDKNNHWTIKAPKSYAGDRYIDYPDFVANHWKGVTGRLTTLCPDDISHRFEHVLKAAGLQHFRFHDLRHFSASIQHALGVPDAYIQQRGGWQNDGILKQVYRHTLEEQTKQMTAKINDHFSALHDTKT